MIEQIPKRLSKIDETFPLNIVEKNIPKSSSNENNVMSDLDCIRKAKLILFQSVLNQFIFFLFVTSILLDKI